MLVISHWYCKTLTVKWSAQELEVTGRTMGHNIQAATVLQHAMVELFTVSGLSVGPPVRIL